MDTKKAKHSLLIVDDEADIRDILEFNLSSEGFDLDMAESAEQALVKISNNEYSLVLLDVMMSGISGFRMAEQLRKSGNSTPIIFLTAKDTENDMLTGFSTGADDYISKPFSIKEVIARIKSVLKRTETQSVPSEAENVIKVNNLIVTLDAKTVYIDNKVLNLTKTEYNILLLFIKNEGKLFSREDILNKVWHKGEVVVERTVDVHITRLRKKLEHYGECIINRKGYGYSFNSDKLNS